MNLIEILPIINESIENSKFSPLVGVGCSRLNSLGSILENERATIVRRLLYLSSLSRNNVRSKDIETYLMSIISTRLYSYKKVDNPENSYFEKFDSRFLSILSNFQLKLIELGTLFSILFGKISAEHCLPIFDLEEDKISIDLNTSNCGDSEAFLLCELLTELCNRAKALTAHKYPLIKEIHNYIKSKDLNVRSGSSGLSTDGIYQRILFLCLEIIPCHSVPKPRYGSCTNDFATWRDSHKGELGFLMDVVHPIDPNIVEIKFKHIEWINNLLWHTLRFDLNMYPTTQELSFQISLWESALPPRKVPLSLAAFVQSENYLPNLLDVWFKYYEKQYSIPSQFYLALAGTLYSMHIKSSKYIDSRREYQLRGDYTNEDVPIMYSTNYDYEMERAFNMLCKYNYGGYHVVFPAIIILRGEYEDIHAWAMFTRIYRVDKEFPEDHLEILDPNANIAPSILGPVIVKMHGSPLHRLPRVVNEINIPDIVINVDITNVVTIVHRVVISEKDYLDDIASTISKSREHGIKLPEWLANIFKGTKGKELFFLGYSVSDTNIRIRLSLHLKHFLYNSIKRYAINITYDPYQAFLLGKLMDIVLIKGDLNNLVSWFWDNDNIRDTIEALAEEYDNV